MKTAHLVGWTLLFLGLGLIVWSLLGSYDIFQGQAPAPEIFRAKTPLFVTPKPSGELEQQAEVIIQEYLSQIFPPDYIPQLLNLAAWSVFVGIVMFAGAQIALVGVKLIKTTK